MCIALLLAPTTALASSPAPSVLAPTTWFYVASPGNLSNREWRRVEAALTEQANYALRPAWNTPVIGFGESGIPIYLESLAQIQRDCGLDEGDGCHGVQADGTPIIWVETNASRSYETEVLSHEMIETLTDPNDATYINGSLAEAADPVSGNYYSYTVKGGDVTVADFVYPNWFTPGPAGPWDFMHTIRGPLQTSAQGFRYTAS